MSIFSGCHQAVVLRRVVAKALTIDLCRQWYEGSHALRVSVVTGKLETNTKHMLLTGGIYSIGGNVGVVICGLIAYSGKWEANCSWTWGNC